jgi:GrpB-like predicted nucleotidyltransferase (UPF0157 family)
MVEMGGAFWDRHLLFRDYLRAHPDQAAEYARIKRELAGKLGADREAYTDAKTPFVSGAEERARAWRAERDRAATPEG